MKQSIICLQQMDPSVNPLILNILDREIDRENGKKPAKGLVAFQGDVSRKDSKRKGYVPPGNKVFRLSDHEGEFTIHMPLMGDLRFILYLHHCTDAAGNIEKVKNTFLSFFLEPIGPEPLGVVLETPELAWPWVWKRGDELLKDPLQEFGKLVLAHEFFEKYYANAKARKIDAQKAICDGLIRGLLHSMTSLDNWRDQAQLDEAWMEVRLPGEAPRIREPTEILENLGTQYVPGSYHCAVYLDVDRSDLVKPPTQTLCIEEGYRISDAINGAVPEDCWIFTKLIKKTDLKP